MRRNLKSFVAAVTVAAAVISVISPASAKDELRPIGTLIAGQYIVVFDDAKVADAAPVARSLASQYDAEILYTYQHALRGFAARMTPLDAMRVAQDGRVAWVEQDATVGLVATQSNPPWGLDRIDQRDLPLSSSYTYTATGSGVRAYIIDTGIRFSHAQFGGRATSGYDAVDGGSADDCNGHGTHVAGTVGGSTYGVAKNVSLVGIRVLDCNGSGSTSGVIAGVDWVTQNRIRPAVANMSLGGGASSSLDTAVSNSINAGVTYAIAAGNGDVFGNPQNACNYSPARVTAAITVGATDSADRKASWSNYGSCLDLFAPGVSILSSWYTGDTATNTISGTSMATPHVAGVAALYLQGNTGASPATVASAINNNATTGKVTSAGSGSPNRLLYMGFIGGGGGTNNPPAANFTFSCSGLTCSFTDTSTDSDGSIASRSWNFGDGTTSTATNPSKTYAASGTYTVTLTVTDNGGATGSTSKSVTVSSGSPDPNPGVPNLTNGVATSGTNSTLEGYWHDYKIQVPSGMSQLKVELSGVTTCYWWGCDPDLDLYVRRAALPTTGSYTCRSISPTSTETCTISAPAGDWWYVSVYVYYASVSRSFTIKATYS